VRIKKDFVRKRRAAEVGRCAARRAFGQRNGPRLGVAVGFHGMFGQDGCDVC
jgi:hypothetical protein